MVSLPNGSELLEEYYRTAPDIVRRIQASPQRSRHLETIFATVKEAVVLIEAGHAESAVSAYASLFCALKDRYGDA